MTAQKRSTTLLGGGPVAITAAAALLRSGGLVAFPTETVFGLGADAGDPHAIAALYAAKGRPQFNPLIAHVPDIEAATREGHFNHDAKRLAEAFWPGPLTLVVPVAPEGSVCELARAGLNSVGLRVPAHPVALSLLHQVGRPVAAPSANRSGRVSAVTPEHVRDDLDGRIDAVLAGEGCRIGVESTIVSCLDGQARLLRPGGTPRAALEAALGRALDMNAPQPAHTQPRSPGLLTSHYAPRALLRLNAAHLEPGEAGLDFAGQFGVATKNSQTLDLSPRGDTMEAAAHLFAYLRALDALGPERIAVATIPDHGLGEAVNDRLHRAAAPRD